MPVVTSPQTATGLPAPVADRIVDAAVTLIAAQGLRSTSVDDIAAAAGCGRATVYRWFPGGRAELLDVTLGRGVDRIFDVCARVVAECDSLADAAAAVINLAVIELTRDAVVQQLLLDEPDTMATFISPLRIEPLVDRSAAWATVHLDRFAAPDVAAYVGEWCVRVITDHLRSPAPVIDISDPAIARRLVDAFLLPELPPTNDFSRP